MAFPGHRPQLFHWRRLTAEAGATPKFDSDNVERWIKRVEQASEYAVSEAFSIQKPSYLQGLCGPVMNLESMEQLQDHDEAYEEAQELLSNWIKSKLQLELMSDGEEEAGSVLLEQPSAAFLKYQRFDDLCSYLEHELASSSVQEYLQHLLQSKVVDCGIVEDLRTEDIKEKEKPADPRITMELRHKQVKENRVKYQKALELQRQEKALKKSVLFEAKQRAQEEDRRKALKAKKEEDAIQREMVKLRKEMAEKRHVMAEAWRMEGKRQEKSQKLSMQEVSITLPLPLDLKKEEQGKEKQRKVQELLSRIHTDNQKCLQRHFSAWFKLILEHRIKMGKARAFADWKRQLKALRAWRNYNWAQKVERETQQLEVHLQDQNSLPVSHGPENTGAGTQSRRPSSRLTSAHPILKAMEERAIQRAERRRKLEEAKQQREEEKLAQLKAKEEAHQRKEAEEKKVQQEKRQEERRQQKLKELEKQRRLEKEQQLQKKASDHYEKVLLRKLGLLPWKRLREEAKKNLMVAQRHHCLDLQKKCLMAWLQHTQNSLMEKVSRAEDFYSLTLLRMGFRNWLKYKEYLSTLEERVSTLHTAYLKKKYFWAWFDLIMEEKSTLWEELKIATEHSNKRLMLSTFKAWRQYPLLMKKEREKEERKNQLRRRVAEILPDFQT
nr:coiled-coil domain-containing protein 191 isoform X2 [Dromaius novaehollandiae]